jgi:hypothetical protein
MSGHQLHAASCHDDFQKCDGWLLGDYMVGFLRGGPGGGAVSPKIWERQILASLHP